MAVSNRNERCSGADARTDDLRGLSQGSQVAGVPPKKLRGRFDAYRSSINRTNSSMRGRMPLAGANNVTPLVKPGNSKGWAAGDFKAFRPPLSFSRSRLARGLSLMIAPLDLPLPLSP